MKRLLQFLQYLCTAHEDTTLIRINSSDKDKSTVFTHVYVRGK